MSTASSPDTPSTAQDKKVDVTFVVNNQRRAFFCDSGDALVTDVLRDEGVSFKIFERLELPLGFQLSDVPTLSENTRLLVVDCLIESPEEISEGSGTSTGLRFVEEVRKMHPDLPIWLLDPINTQTGGAEKIKTRTQASSVERVYLLDTMPDEFAEKVKAVLGKK